MMLTRQEVGDFKMKLFFDLHDKFLKEDETR